MFEKGIAVIGSTTIDENMTSAGRWRKIGGVTTYAGLTYQRHGIETTIVTNIASKDSPVRTPFEKENVVINSGRTAHTTHFINEVTKNNRRQKIPFRAAAVNTDNVAKSIKLADCIHLGPLHPGDIEPSGGLRYSTGLVLVACSDSFFLHEMQRNRGKK